MLTDGIFFIVFEPLSIPDRFPVFLEILMLKLHPVKADKFSVQINSQAPLRRGHILCN
jgi:hypothetical protein